MYDANIQTVALISGIPELSSLLLRPLFAYCIDYIRSRPNGYGVGKVGDLSLMSLTSSPATPNLTLPVVAQSNPILGSIAHGGIFPGLCAMEQRDRIGRLYNVG